MRMSWARGRGHQYHLGMHPPVTPICRVAHALHTTFLGIWTGAIVMTGAAAAIIFPQMKALAPTLPSYPAMPQDTHWLLAAGHIAARVFRIADTVQLACALVVLATGVMLARSRAFSRSALGMVRAIALVAALLLAAYYLGVLAPRMTVHLHEHWRLAEAGDVAGARVHQDAFHADHPTSSRTLGATALCTLVAALLGAGAPVVARGSAPKDQA